MNTTTIFGKFFSFFATNQFLSLRDSTIASSASKIQALRQVMWLNMVIIRQKHTIVLEITHLGLLSNYLHIKSHDQYFFQNGFFRGTPETHSRLWYCRFVIGKGGEKMRPRLLNNEKYQRKRIRKLRCPGKIKLTHEVLKTLFIDTQIYVIFLIILHKLYNIDYTDFKIMQALEFSDMPR